MVPDGIEFCAITSIEEASTKVNQAARAFPDKPDKRDVCTPRRRCNFTAIRVGGKAFSGGPR
jgi:hypothetical protein